MSLFRNVLPANPPAHIAAQGEMAVMRERVLQTVALFFAGFGVITYIVAMRDAIAQHSLSDGTAFTVIFAATLLVAFLRNLPYRLRSGMLLTILLSGAIYSFIQYGLGGSARIFLFTFISLCGMLLGMQAGTISLVASFLILGFFAVGMIVGFIPAPPLGANADSGNWTDWALAVTYFVLLATTATITSSTIVRSLENSLHRQKSLTDDLAREHETLENRVAERTTDLQRRLIQIRTTVEINRAINSLLDPQILLQEVVNLVQQRMNLYYAGVFLLDDSRTFAVLRAGSGTAGEKMLAAGHRLQVGGSSMIGWTIANRKARIALNTGKEAIRFNNPNLPLTRSELAIPVMSGNRILGAMTIQSTSESAFDEDDILIFQSISDSLAIALENARLYQQSQQDLDEIRALNRQYLEKVWMEMHSTHDHLDYTYTNPTARPSASPNVIQVPITLRDTRIGQLQLETGSAALTEEEMDMVEAITSQTALAVESARLLEETQNRAAQEGKINQLTEQFSQALNIDEILKTALVSLGGIPSVSEVAVRLYPQNDSSIDSREPSANPLDEIGEDLKR
jgi:GAF domain-containing protein